MLDISELLLKSLFYSFLLFVLCALALCTSEGPLPTENPAGFIGAYYCLEDVINVFKKDEYKDYTSSIKLLRMFEALKEDVGNVSAYESSYPFIAVEGNHRSRRFVIARQLARSLRATNLRSPPEFLNFLKYDFKEIETRRAFYSLALYANDLEARRLLQQKPVVTSGYWLDIAAFCLAKKYPVKLPDENSTEMQWPKDLLMPDIVFYINSPPVPHVFLGDGMTTKAPNPIKPRLLDVYRSWKRPRVVELNDNIFSYNEMYTEMFRHINFVKHVKFKNCLKETKDNMYKPKL